MTVTLQGLTPLKKNGRVPLHLCKHFTCIPFNEGSHEDGQTTHPGMIRIQVQSVQLARHLSGCQGRPVFVANQWLINASFHTASNPSSSSRSVSKQEAWYKKVDRPGQAAPRKRRHLSLSPAYIYRRVISPMSFCASKNMTLGPIMTDIIPHLIWGTNMGGGRSQKESSAGAACHFLRVVFLGQTWERKAEPRRAQCATNRTEKLQVGEWGQPRRFHLTLTHSQSFFSLQTQGLIVLHLLCNYTIKLAG